MNLRIVLIIGAVVLAVVARLSMVFVPLTAWSGWMPKKWQLWMLGQNRDSNLPKRENVVM
jgi:hypothetical protein